MTLYIAGPITNHPDFEKSFAVAAELLRDAGYEVINPCALRHKDPTNWSACMKLDVVALLSRANGIALMDGWRNSRGARIEYNLCCELAIPNATVAEWIAFQGK